MPITEGVLSQSCCGIIMEHVKFSAKKGEIMGHKEALQDVKDRFTADYEKII
ncbi:MAG: hypothetical protein ACLR7D_05820 [Lachnospira eligens]